MRLQHCWMDCLRIQECFHFRAALLSPAQHDQNILQSNWNLLVYTLCIKCQKNTSILTTEQWWIISVYCIAYLWSRTLTTWILSCVRRPDAEILSLQHDKILPAIIRIQSYFDASSPQWAC